MDQKRLNELAIISIEGNSSQPSDFDEIIDKFHHSKHVKCNFKHLFIRQANVSQILIKFGTLVYFGPLSSNLFFVFFLSWIFWPLEGFKVGKMSVLTKTSRYFDLKEIEKK